MKKVKIMLTAIAVLAVVGGALAFKAKKFGDLCVYTIVDQTCVLDTQHSYRIDNFQPQKKVVAVEIPAEGCTTDVLPATTTTTDCNNGALKVVIE